MKWWQFEINTRANLTLHKFGCRSGKPYISGFFFTAKVFYYFVSNTWRSLLLKCNMRGWKERRLNENDAFFDSSSPMTYALFLQCTDEAFSSIDRYFLAKRPSSGMNRESLTIWRWLTESLFSTCESINWLSFVISA